MYEGTARVHFIFAGTSKKSEMLYIIWVNVGGAIHLLQLQKENLLHWGKKYGFIIDFFIPKAILFTPCQYILLFSNCNNMYKTNNI